MRIRAVAYKGQPVTQALEAIFSETGGTIGRAATNTLVLPDPEKHLSRLQASVTSRAGRYIIKDLGGTNLVYLNGRELGHSVEAPLGDGDRLSMGDYTLEVTVSEFEPSAGAGAATLKGEVQEPPAGVSEAVSHPFAEPPAKPAQVIPEDFDPFADRYASKPLSEESSATPKLSEDWERELGPRQVREQSLDEWFELGAGKKSLEPFGPGHPLGEETGGRETPLSGDVLRDLGICGPSPSAATVADEVPELHGAFSPPPARLERTPDSPEVPQATEGVAAPAQPKPPTAGRMFVSWESESTTASAPPVEPAEPARRAERAQPQEPTVTETQDVLRMFDTGKAGAQGEGDILGIEAYSSQVPEETPTLPHAATEPTPLPRAEEQDRLAVAARAESPAANEELLQALLQGLGTPNLKIPGGLTPEVMEAVGRLLREAVRGTVDLLLARALTKREIRANVTILVGKENNPLKFSPDVDVALTHLLNPPARGFMPPATAMRDAYDDLRAHTFGFMAGMRAALAGVLARFDPENLQKRLAHKTVLDSFMATSRRAKLWDLFEQMYGEISREAEDDFDELFGKAFLRAYEEQVARLRSRDGNE